MPHPSPKPHHALAPVDAFTGEALYSPCQRYRYTLSRVWPDGTGSMAFVLLNPSTATAEVNDPTIRRCCGYARAWGFRELQILNIFALRSTDPKLLYQVDDPVGPKNISSIRRIITKTDLLICAWGTHGAHQGQGKKIAAKLIEWRGALKCLGVTASGHPKHPLYLKASLQPVDYDPSPLLLA